MSLRIVMRAFEGSSKSSGRACKPDSVQRCIAHSALQTPAIIPLGPGSHRDSSSLPEGFQFTRLAPRKMECVPLQERPSMSRASSPLLFGLAPRGVFRARAIASEAVGSYPTFSPLPTVRALRDVSNVLPARCHRAALPPAFLFSVALSVASPCSEAPWRYQARCPVKSSGQQIVGHAPGRCPDFPPATAPCGPAASDYPARPLCLVYPANATWNRYARKNGNGFKLVEVAGSYKSINFSNS